MDKIEIIVELMSGEKRMFKASGFLDSETHYGIEVKIDGVTECIRFPWHTIKEIIEVQDEL